MLGRDTPTNPGCVFRRVINVLNEVSPVFNHFIVKLLGSFELDLVRENVHISCQGEIAVNVFLVNEVFDNIQMGNFEIDDFCGCFNTVALQTLRCVVVNIRPDMTACKDLDARQQYTKPEP